MLGQARHASYGHGCRSVAGPSLALAWPCYSVTLLSCLGISAAMASVGVASCVMSPSTFRVDVENSCKRLLTGVWLAAILRLLRDGRFAGRFGGTETRMVLTDRTGFLFNSHSVFSPPGRSLCSPCSHFSSAARFSGIPAPTPLSGMTLAHKYCAHEHKLTQGMGARTH